MVYTKEISQNLRIMMITISIIIYNHIRQQYMTILIVVIIMGLEKEEDLEIKLPTFTGL